MLRRILALCLILHWGVLLGWAAFDADHGRATVAFSTSVPLETVWAQPAAGSHDLVRPPERNPLHPFLPCAVEIAMCGARDLGARLRLAVVERRQPRWPSRRVLHHASSRDDGQPA